MGILWQGPTILLRVSSLPTMNALQSALKSAVVACLADGTQLCWLVSFHDLGWLPCSAEQTALNLFCISQEVINILLFYFQALVRLFPKDFNRLILNVFILFAFNALVKE